MSRRAGLEGARSRYDSRVTEDGYRPQSRDTTREADLRMFAVWRALDGTRKLELLSEHCRALHRLSVAGLAARYPDASAEELELRAACLRVGRDVVERLTGVVLEW